MNSKIAMRSTSTVVMTGELHDGTVLTQEFNLTHDPGAPDPNIIATAFKLARDLQGFVFDGPDGTMIFHPWSNFKSSILFAVKKVQIAQPGFIS